jgi:hypothetical protein
MKRMPWFIALSAVFPAETEYQNGKINGGRGCRRRELFKSSGGVNLCADFNFAQSVAFRRGIDDDAGVLILLQWRIQRDF